MTIMIKNIILKCYKEPPTNLLDQMKLEIFQFISKTAKFYKTVTKKSFDTPMGIYRSIYTRHAPSGFAADMLKTWNKRMRVWWAASEQERRECIGEKFILWHFGECHWRARRKRHRCFVQQIPRDRWRGGDPPHPVEWVIAEAQYYGLHQLALNEGCGHLPVGRRRKPKTQHQSYLDFINST